MFMSLGEFSTIDDAVQALRNLVEDAKRSGISSEVSPASGSEVADPLVGIGPENADLMVIAQSLGNDHEALFSQGAGKLLSDILQAIGLSVQDVYLCHLVNRLTTKPKDKEKILPLLKEKIAAVKPSLVLVLGREITQVLQNSSAHGQFFEYEGVVTMSTLHPSHLLQNPSDKKVVWEDMKKLHEKLCATTGKNFQLKGSK